MGGGKGVGEGGGGFKLLKGTRFIRNKHKNRL